MALFCAAISMDSVSFLRFLCHSHVQVFLSEILPFCRLKYPYSCFYSHVCFRVIVVMLNFMSPVLLLSAVMSLSLLFFNVVFESSY